MADGVVVNDQKSEIEFKKFDFFTIFSDFEVNFLSFDDWSQPLLQLFSFHIPRQNHPSNVTN